MVISISSTSTIAELGVKTPSPTPIMEDSAAFVPPSAMVAKEVAQRLVIPPVHLRLEPLGK